MILAGIEDGRLATIGGTRIEAVLQADRNDRLFNVVSIQIAEDHVERAVGRALPALVYRDDRLSRFESDMELSRLRLGVQADGREQQAPGRQPPTSVH